MIFNGVVILGNSRWSTTTSNMGCRICLYRSKQIVVQFTRSRKGYLAGH